MIVLSRLADSMLDRERFDLLVTDPSARSCRRSNGSTSIICHYLHERHRALVPHVEAVLREMKDSGELEQLRTKLVTQALEKAGEPRG